VQSYAAGSINCETKPKKEIHFNDTEKSTDVICMYQALCEPLGPGEVNTLLEEKNVDDLFRDPAKRARSTFKLSMVACRGSGITTNGNLTSSDCPDITLCAKDVLFNANFASTSNSSENVISPQNEIKKDILRNAVSK